MLHVELVDAESNFYLDDFVVTFEGRYAENPAKGKTGNSLCRIQKHRHLTFQHYNNSLTTGTTDRPKYIVLQYTEHI